MLPGFRIFQQYLPIYGLIHSSLLDRDFPPLLLIELALPPVSRMSSLLLPFAAPDRRRPSICYFPRCSLPGDSSLLGVITLLLKSRCITLSRFMDVFVGVQGSEPYMRMLSTIAWYMNFLVLSIMYTPQNPGSTVRFNISALYD